MKPKLFKWSSIYGPIMLLFWWQVGFSQSSNSGFVVINSPETIQHWVGKKLPSFTNQDLEGNSYSSESMKGKIIVINLWSVTCHPCIEEMPLLSKLVRQYADRGVVFLAPAPEGVDKIAPILARQPFKYAVLPQAQDLFKSLGLLGYPYHIVVNKEGFIRFIRTGTINPKTRQKIAESDLPAAIEQELK